MASLRRIPAGQCGCTDGVLPHFRERLGDELLYIRVGARPEIGFIGVDHHLVGLHLGFAERGIECRPSRGGGQVVEQPLKGRVEEVLILAVCLRSRRLTGPNKPSPEVVSQK